MAKFLGIVIAPGDVQSDGLQQVMDRLQGAGAQAICTGLGMVEAVGPGEGHRAPPLDIDGYERVLDRPLFGKKELWLKGYRTHAYDESLFADTPYRPGGRACAGASRLRSSSQDPRGGPLARAKGLHEPLAHQCARRQA